MAPRNESSHLKRARNSPSESELDAKKPRRSERLSQRVDSHADAGPSAIKTPVAHLSTEDSSDQRFKEATATPPDGRPSQMAPRGTHSGDGTNGSSDELQNGSYSSDTQAIASQFTDPNQPLSEDVKDEVKEGVWGYLLPLQRYGTSTLVMKRRTGCGEDAASGSGSSSSRKKSKKKGSKDEDAKDARSGGYLIGRHRECDVVLEDLMVSNRHCLIFAEHQGQDTVAVLEDLSSNGTFVNEAMVGRNQRRELQENDEIAILDRARFIFRYPRSRTSSAFSQQYSLHQKLGKGHFAEVYLCVERATGKQYAVKKFTMPPGREDRSTTEGLQQEIAVLMGVSHPNVLCLKDTFHEQGSVYLVLELASGGELFEYIVGHQKLSEAEARKLFKQLFAGIKYLHDRNIVHRDIKPENILLLDQDLHVKLADFGLAKIIGEESFTTTLCGTPSYVAPEILADTRNRKYTKAVDIWSLGVVLYICLCGFPPFSDELYSDGFPYNMTQQIRSGQFNYPSPYWDSVGDPALDLIDSMLVVDPARRFTVDQCLMHPWMTSSAPSLTDSTDGLVGGVAGLNVNRRGLVMGGLSRERTLISALGRGEMTRVPAIVEPAAAAADHSKDKDKGKHAEKETRPADYQTAGAFMELGDRGDPSLYDGDDTAIGSPLAKTDIGASKEKAKEKTKETGKDKDKDTSKDKSKDKSKGKGKGKGKGR